MTARTRCNAGLQFSPLQTVNMAPSVIGAEANWYAEQAVHGLDGGVLLGPLFPTCQRQWVLSVLKRLHYIVQRIADFSLVAEGRCVPKATNDPNTPQR